MPALLTICARTNKVASKRSQKTLALICTYCKLPVSLLPFFREAVKDKAPSLRAAAVECALTLLQAMDGEKDLERLRRRGVGENVEIIIKHGATDASSEVRGLTKALFQVYMGKYPDRVEA